MEGGVFETSVSVLSFTASSHTQWLCSLRGNNLRYQRAGKEKFHFQSSGSIYVTLGCQVKSNCINLKNTA